MAEPTLLSRRRLVSAAATSAAGIAVLIPSIASAATETSDLQTLGAELKTVHAARLAFDATHPDEDDPLYERHWQLREAINRLPATCSAELAVKARAAQMAHHFDPTDEWEGDGTFRDLSKSLIDDVLAMSKGGING